MFIIFTYFSVKNKKILMGKFFIKIKLICYNECEYEDTIKEIKKFQEKEGFKTWESFNYLEGKFY